jgi:serine phosphatase RsbU (regulator of sigma subunit)
MNDDGHDLTERTLVLKQPPVAPAAQTIGHFLSWTEDGQVRRVAIGPDGLRIGRTAPCDLILPSSEVSRRHCRIDVDGDWARVTDLGSTNGTVIEGRRIEAPTRLRNGTRVMLGTLVLNYERRDVREVAEEAELTAELRGAADYVRAILPDPITSGPVQTQWCFVPCSKLGGDAFGYDWLADGALAGFIVDISGHGIGAAMYAATVANTLRQRAIPGADFTDPASVAQGLNALFPMERHNFLMLTLWYFVYQPATRRLRYCAAGHHAALLQAAPGVAPVALAARGPSIGMMPTGNWVSHEAEMPPGSRLFVFSDGAFEITTESGAAWSLDDLARLIAEPETSGTAAAQRLYQAVRAAARGGRLEDDFSVMVLSFA